MHARSPLMTLVLTMALGAGPATAALTNLPPNFADEVIASGLDAVSALEIAPDGRIFVCEAFAGRLRVIKNGTLLPTPFLTVGVSATGERGLLGVTFDPNFATNRFVYVYYTATSPTVHNRLSRFRASATNPDVAEAGSEVHLLNLPTLGPTNHNGGAIHFGPDGKLYVAVGDNANSSNAQSMNTPLGKMLRINPDPANLIPPDNPFVGTTTGLNRAIWATGLRNPFTFSFQRGTGRMHINDVGQNSGTGREEVNVGARGMNYDWPNSQGGPTSYFSYPTGTGGCAIVGAAFYNPVTVRFPQTFVGRYFFADYCQGWIRHISSSGPAGAVQTFANNAARPVDLAVGNDGHLYVLSRGQNAPAVGTGSVIRVRFTGTQAPSISSHPADQTVPAGSAASFSCSAAGTPPIRYQWQRNRADIPGATSTTHNFTAQVSDNGALFRCIATNDFGDATSNEARLTVTAPNAAPTAVINQPATGTLFNAGQPIAFSGAATDPEDGTLPASAFTWTITLWHDGGSGNVHPHGSEVFSGVRSGSFTPAPEGHQTEAEIWYRVHLEVRDSGNQRGTAERDVHSRKVQMTLVTNPAGLQVRDDGSPVTAPVTQRRVVGMRQTIGVTSPQTSGGQPHLFARWSDGGLSTHQVTIPATDVTYTADFRPAADYVEVTPPAANVSASTSDTNLPGNTVDGNIGTRWSGNGDGAWLRFDLGSARTVGHAAVAVYNGNGRRNRFDLEIGPGPDGPWTPLFNGESSGTTTLAETYDFPDTEGRYVRYVGHGSSVGTFNSVTEVRLFAVGVITPTPTPTPTISPTPTPTPSPTPTPTPVGEVELPITSVSASTHDGNVPANAVDGSLGTRWSASGDGQWIQLNLMGPPRRLTSVAIGVYNGNARRNRFDLQWAPAATGPWTNILTNVQTSGTTTQEERFDFPDVNGVAAIRYVGHTGTLNAGGTTPWNSVTEISVFVPDAPGPTASASTSASSVPVGGTVEVTARTNMGLAQFSVIVEDTATGREQDLANPIFTPGRPSPLQPGSLNPAVWTLTAARPGRVVFRVGVHGELFNPICGCFTFMNASASTEAVTVTAGP